MLNPGNASTPVRTPEDILRWVRQTLHQQFRLDPRTVTPEANLFTDLGLDSIDAVELAIQLQQYTHKRMKAEDFKQVRTIQDVVDTLHKMLQDA